MKKHRLSLVLAAALLLEAFSLPVLAADTYGAPQDEAQYQDFSSMTVPDEDELYDITSTLTHDDYIPRALSESETLHKGIDVSSYQGEIDWEAVAADGIEFAFIRAGYRGWGTGALISDSQMANNIEGALANGIQVGVYIFSQATTTAEAEEEAAFVLDLIEGYDITLPVVIDYEYAEQNGGYTGRLYKADLSVDEATTVCGAFCSAVEDAGYQSAVYANVYMLTKHLDAGLLPTVWMANFTTETAYSGDYDFWQCSSIGSVDGISTRVDLDFWFEDSADIKLPFRDVSKTVWSYSAIQTAYSVGLIQGVSTHSFSPYTNTTRAQLALMLYRMNGTPTVTGSSSFTDLTQDWYKTAVIWAQQQGIITGTSDTTFSPDDPITREQLVTMLYRMSGSPSTSGDLSGFTDAALVSDYAQSAVSWASENGILKGSDGAINPKGNATRQEVAAFLTRYIDYSGI